MNLTELKKKRVLKLLLIGKNVIKNLFFYLIVKLTKFINYKNLAIKKKCKFIICNIKFKKNIKQNSIKYFFYKNKKDLENIAKIFYNFNDLKINFCYRY